MPTCPSCPANVAAIMHVCVAIPTGVYLPSRAWKRARIA